MGCWNETCYISKLPILLGEEVVLILLREREYIYDKRPYTSYAYEKYVPFGLPIFGKYNEYGNIEDVTNASDVLEYLRCIDVVNYEGNTLDTKSLTKETLTEFTEKIYTEGEYFLKNELGKNIPLYGMMIKKELYNRILNHFKNRKCLSKNETYEEHIREKIKEFDEIPKKYAHITDEITRENLQNFAINSIEATSILIPDKPFDITSFLKNKIFKDKDEKAIDYLIDIVVFSYCLKALRMGYYCISGAGSQSEEMLIHKEVAKFVLEQCDKKVKEYRELNKKYCDINDKPATDEEILSDFLF